MAAVLYAELGRSTQIRKLQSLVQTRAQPGGPFGGR